MMCFTHRVPRATAVAVLAAACAFCSGHAEADTVDFEDLSLAAETFENGLPGPPYGSNDFVSGGVTFTNTTGLDTSIPGYEYEWWTGWGYSNITDNSDHAPLNYLYDGSAYPASGARGTSNYAVAYGDAYGDPAAAMLLPKGVSVEGAYFAATSYSYYSMLNGSGFSDPVDAEGEFMSVTALGYDAADQPTGAEVTFYLADFRSANPADWYYLTDWTWVDLSPLDGARKLMFQFDADASNKSDFIGVTSLDHPAYFAMDNLRVTPEPASLMLLLAGAMMVFGWRRRR